MSIPKVLLADDNEKNMRLLEMTLKQENYQLLICRDGEEALKTYISEKPDLVILDALMPKMDGFTVCRKIREHKDSRHVPVIISSAIYKEDVYRNESENLGADEFLPKPIKPSQLLETVRALLARKKEA